MLEGSIIDHTHLRAQNPAAQINTFVDQAIHLSSITYPLHPCVVCPRASFLRFLLTWITGQCVFTHIPTSHTISVSLGNRHCYLFISFLLVAYSALLLILISKSREIYLLECLFIIHRIVFKLWPCVVFPSELLFTFAPFLIASSSKSPQVLVRAGFTNVLFLIVFLVLFLASSFFFKFCKTQALNFFWT